MTENALTEDAARRRLEAFEREHRVYELTARGVSLWRLLRFEVSSALQGISVARNYPTRFSLLKSSLRTLDLLLHRRRDIVFLCRTFDSALRERTEEGYRDVHFDTLIAAVPGGEKMIFRGTRGFEAACGRPAVPPSIDDTGIFVASAALARCPVEMGHGEIAAQMSRLITTGLGLPQYDPSVVGRKLRTFVIRRAMYKMLLSRVRPGCIVAASNGQYSLVSAANLCRIPFVELQHGVLNAGHGDILPDFALDMADPAALCLPDLLGLYSSYWRRKIEGTALDRLNRLEVVGMPVVGSPPQATIAPISLLVTTQGFRAPALASLLADAMQFVDSDCRVVVKLHPAYNADRETYRAILGGDGRVSIVSGDDSPTTAQLLAACELHASISSACHFDALALGKPTAVIALKHHDLVADLVERGDAYLASSARELAELVMTRPWKDRARQIGSEHVPPDHVAKMKTVIQRANDGRLADERP